MAYTIIHAGYDTNLIIQRCAIVNSHSGATIDERRVTVLETSGVTAREREESVEVEHAKKYGCPMLITEMCDDHHDVLRVTRVGSTRDVTLRLEIR
jgi:protein-tyrosine-phosphatase